MSPVALRLLNKAWFKRCDPCQMDAYRRSVSVRGCF